MPLKNLLSLLFLAITICVFSQGYKKEKINMNMRYFPLDPLPEELTTYSSTIDAEGIDFKYIKLNKPAVWIESGSNTNYGSVEESERDFLILHGYDRVSEDADIRLNVTFTKPQTLNKELYKKECTFFENKQKIQTTCYYYDIKYTFGARFTVTSKAGEIIYDSLYFDPEKEYNIWLGDIEYANNLGAGSFTSQSELEANYKAKFEIDFFETQITKFLKFCRSHLMNQYGYPLYIKEWIIANDKTNNKLNYDDLNKATQLFTEACQEMTTEQANSFRNVFDNKEAVESYMSKLSEAIIIWETALQEADFEDKKARIHRKLAPNLYVNLALAYYLKQEWDKAIENAEMAMKYKESSKEAAFVRSQILDMKNRYEINNVAL